VFADQENVVCTLKWPSLTAKTGKKSSFCKEKSLVGWTPEQILNKVLNRKILFFLLILEMLSDIQHRDQSFVKK
jgi:hypothetical protein